MKTYSRKNPKSVVLQSENENDVFREGFEYTPDFSSSDGNEKQCEDNGNCMEIMEEKKKGALQESRRCEDNNRGKSFLGKKRKPQRFGIPRHQKRKNRSSAAAAGQQKKKFKWSEDEHDWSIEKLRRDPEMTWQQKVDLLLPKMHIADNKQIRSEDKDWSNLSYEEVKESDDSSDFTYTYTYTWTSVDETNTSGNAEIETTQKIRKKTISTPSENGNVSSNQDEITERNYEERSTVLGTTEQTCDKKFDQDVNMNSMKKMNSTLNKQGQNIKQVQSPVDISSIRMTQEVQQSGRYKDEEQQPTDKQEQTLKRNKEVLNSTTGKNALNIKSSNFPQDLSSIRTCREDEDIQSCLEKTPNRKSISNVAAPTKGRQTVSRSRKLQPVSPTLLFMNSDTTHSGKAPQILLSKSHPHSMKKNQLDQCKADSIQDSIMSTNRVSHRVLTSTPIRGETNEEKVNRFEADISTVQAATIDDELEIHNSLEVNSMEIVPMYDSVEVPNVIQLANNEEELPSLRKMSTRKRTVSVSKTNSQKDRRPLLNKNKQEENEAKKSISKHHIYQSEKLNDNPGSQKSNVKVVTSAVDVKQIIKGYTDVIAKLQKSNHVNKTLSKSKEKVKPCVNISGDHENTVNLSSKNKLNESNSNFQEDLASSRKKDGKENIIQSDCSLLSNVSEKSEKAQLTLMTSSQKRVQTKDKSLKDGERTPEAEHIMGNLPELSLVEDSMDHDNGISGVNDNNVDDNAEIVESSSQNSVDVLDLQSTTRKGDGTNRVCRKADKVPRSLNKVPQSRVKVPRSTNMGPNQSITSRICSQKSDTSSSKRSLISLGLGECKKESKVHNSAQRMSVPEDDLTNWNFVWPRKKIPVLKYVRKTKCVNSNTCFLEDDIITIFCPLKIAHTASILKD